MPLPDTKPVQSFDDIITSMKNYYQLSGGRVLCHFFTYIMLYFDKSIFNFINGLFFVTLGYLIYLHTKKETSNNLFILPLIYLSLLLLLPQFGNTCIWLSGATNYLWPTVILITCFLIINKYAEKQSPPVLLLLYLSVTVSSFTNETTAGMVIIFLLITFGIEHKKLTAKLIPVFILSLIGMITVITAPGNFNRADNVEKTSIFDLSKLASTFCIYLEYLFKHYYLFLFVIAFSICLSIRSRKKISDIIVLNKYFITGFLGISALASLGFLSEHPIFIGFVPMIIGGIISIYNIINFYRNNKLSLLQNVLLTFTNTAIVIIIIAPITYIAHYTDLVTAIYTLTAGIILLFISFLIRKNPSNFKSFEKCFISLNSLLKNINIKSYENFISCTLISIMLLVTIKNSVQYFKAMEYYSNFTNDVISLVLDNNYQNIVYIPLLKDDVGTFYPSEAFKYGGYHISWIAMNYGVYIKL